MSAIRVAISSLLICASGVAGACDMHGGRGFGLWAHLQNRSAEHTETTGNAVVALAPPSPDDHSAPAPAVPEPTPTRLKSKQDTKQESDAQDPKDRRPRGVPLGPLW